MFSFSLLGPDVEHEGVGDIAKERWISQSRDFTAAVSHVFCRPAPCLVLFGRIFGENIKSLSSFLTFLLGLAGP